MCWTWLPMFCGAAVFHHVAWLSTRTPGVATASSGLSMWLRANDVVLRSSPGQKLRTLRAEIEFATDAPVEQARGKVLECEVHRG